MDEHGSERHAEWVTKYSASRKVVHLAAGQYGLPVEVHVKRYAIKTFLKALLHTVRKSRAREVFATWAGDCFRKNQHAAPGLAGRSERRAAALQHPRHGVASRRGSAYDRWQRCTNDRQRRGLAHRPRPAHRHDGRRRFCHGSLPKSTHLPIFPSRPSVLEEFYIIDLLGGGFPHVLSPLKRARNLFKLVRSFIPRQTDSGFLPEHRRAILKAYAGSEMEADVWENWVERIGRMKGQRV